MADSLKPWSEVPSLARREVLAIMSIDLDVAEAELARQPWDEEVRDKRDALRAAIAFLGQADDLSAVRGLN